MGVWKRRASPARPKSPRLEALQRELVRIRKGIECLLTAYGSSVSGRTAEQDASTATQGAHGSSCVSSLTSQESEKATYLRLAETVSSFLARLKETAHTLDPAGRNKIVRLLVKDILVDDESITIRHFIPRHAGPSSDSGPLGQRKHQQSKPERCYALRSGRHLSAAQQSLPH